jgi:hypothetical protein
VLSDQHQRAHRQYAGHPGCGHLDGEQRNGVVIADPNDPTSAVSNLEIGEHVLVYEIYNGICGFGPPSTDTLTIRVYDGEAPPAQAGNDISWCTPQDNAVLSANDPVFPAVGTWTVLSGTGTIANPNDPNTAVFGLGVGQHDFLWTIDNGSCGSSSDAISVFIYDGESADANAGADQELCTPDTDADLQGNAAVFPATGLWTVTAGTGSFRGCHEPHLHGERPFHRHQHLRVDHHQRPVRHHER